MARKKKSGSKNTHRVYIGDSRSMDAVKDDSVHLAIASPQCLNCGKTGNSCRSKTNIEDLALVWEECFRALVPGCMLCVHVPEGPGSVCIDEGGQPVSAVTCVMKTCWAAGLEYIDVIVWHKELQAKASWLTPDSKLLPRSTRIRGECDSILIFQKPGDAPEVSESVQKKSKMSFRELSRLSSGLWVFPDRVDKNDEKEAFPSELPQRLIRLFSFIGETVLDPFSGAAATICAARDLGRSSIGYEKELDLSDRIAENVAGGKSMKSFSIETAKKLDNRRLSSRRSKIASALDLSKPGKQSGKQSGKKQSSPPQKQETPQPQKQETPQPQKKEPAKPVAHKQGERKKVNSMGIYNIDHIRVEDGRDIKLLGIEVPGEFFSRNPGIYRQSCDYLKKLIVDDEIFAVIPGKKETGGAYVYVSDSKETVNELLIKAGYALSDGSVDHEKRKKFDKLEKDARNNSMGMWALHKTDSPRKNK